MRPIAPMLLTVLLTGCLDAASMCGFDTDCREEEEACVQGSCLLLCTQNSDCGEFPEMSPNNPQCQAVVREVGEAEISICATPGFLETNNSNNNPNSTCTQDAQCRAALGDARAQCSLSGTCIIPAEQHALRITSREMSQDLRGPQILGVYLADAQGAPIGYAVEEVYAPQGLGMSTLQLSGEVPEVEAQGLCVPGASGHRPPSLAPWAGACACTSSTPPALAS